MLVNESPTNEFVVQRGLRQGDPLSPFLFILAMEGLHMAMQHTKIGRLMFLEGFELEGMGLRCPTFSMRTTRSSCVIGRWRMRNEFLGFYVVFFLAFGLKINLHKSKLIGVGVSFGHIEHVAMETGCTATKPPFVYLGLPVGQNMTRIQAWKNIRDRFITKLSRWKAKMLSIGGRLTLLKSVLGSIGSYLMSVFGVPTTVLKSLEALRARFFWGADIGERKIHWVSWSRVLASKDDGGLGVEFVFF